MRHRAAALRRVGCGSARSWLVRASVGGLCGVRMVRVRVRVRARARVRVRVKIGAMRQAHTLLKSYGESWLGYAYHDRV